jgi:hypothetical protein
MSLLSSRNELELKVAAQVAAVELEIEGNVTNLERRLHSIQLVISSLEGEVPPRIQNLKTLQVYALIFAPVLASLDHSSLLFLSSLSLSRSLSAPPFLCFPYLFANTVSLSQNMVIL